MMCTEINKMLELGVLQQRRRDYTLCTIIEEVSCKHPRPCIDYQELNDISRDKTYPITNIEERL